MKKQVIFGLAALLSFSVVFASCGDDDEDTTTTTTTTTTTNNGKEGKYTVAYDAETLLVQLVPLRIFGKKWTTALKSQSRVKANWFALARPLSAGTPRRTAPAHSTKRATN
jgi:uncharacterized lipoprotein YehR (DUF1307 family)